jgi:hypothetical protein
LPHMLPSGITLGQSWHLVHFRPRHFLSGLLKSKQMSAAGFGEYASGARVKQFGIQCGHGGGGLLGLRPEGLPWFLPSPLRLGERERWRLSCWPPFPPLFLDGSLQKRRLEWSPKGYLHTLHTRPRSRPSLVKGKGPERLKPSLRAGCWELRVGAGWLSSLKVALLTASAPRSGNLASTGNEGAHRGGSFSALAV